jgi:citrate lyase beta subunit
LEFAKKIVEKFEKIGPFTIDGLYIDEPIYKNYKNMLKRI